MSGDVSGGPPNEERDRVRHGDLYGRVAALERAVDALTEQVDAAVAERVERAVASASVVAAARGDVTPVDVGDPPDYNIWRDGSGVLDTRAAPSNQKERR